MSGDQELRYWRALAGYLADCHAATAEALPKSASKSSRKRMQNICRIARDAIQDGASAAPLRFYWEDAGLERVCERLERQAAP